MDDLDHIDDRFNNENSFISSFIPLEDSFKILVVDKDSDTHIMFRSSLDKYHFGQKTVTILEAFDRSETESILQSIPDIMLIFLTVDSENFKTDFELIAKVRKTHEACQIVILTEPSVYPDHELIQFYDINDYIDKKDICPRHIKRIVSSSIKSFNDRLSLCKELKIKNKVEKTLMEQKIILKDVIKNIGDILWELNSDLEYIYISKKAETLTGFSRSDFIKKKYTDFITTDSKENSWPDIIEKISARQKFSNIEISRRTSSGDIQYYLVTGNPVYDNNNNYQGYRGADINITELKNAQFEQEKLEAQLRHSQKLEAVGTLAGGIAHDFNNILGGILGYAQLMQFELKDNKTCMSYTEEIVTSCHRARNLIVQILDFSRRDEKSKIKHIANPIEIINETVKLLRASFPSSIKIDAQIDNSTGCIKADPSQVHQAVMNLCTNAKQSIKNSIGQVSISVNEIQHTLEAPIENISYDLPSGEYIRISVSDNGTGIKPDTLDKIFNPYFTTKAKGEGTGLGLSVVHGIVRRFHGAITTRTTPGKGSEFSLFFPKHTLENSNKNKTQNTLVKGNAKVLFIDDEPMLVNIGKTMLEKLGYKVSATGSPLKALSTVQSNPDKYDLVITDMTMPDIHETQLAAKIKQINSDIPILLISGFANLNKIQKMKPENIDAVLPKPIEINALSKTIDQIMSENRA